MSFHPPFLSRFHAHENPRRTDFTELTPNKTNYKRMLTVEVAPHREGNTEQRETDVWISNIYLGHYYSGATTENIVVYADTASKRNAKQMWQRIAAAAGSYPYAQPPNTQGRPNPYRWPNSWYQALGNNSNTFVREMARKIGRNADVLGGFIPGNSSPQPIMDRGPVPYWK